MTEGFRDIVLLFNILKDRTDIGCLNHKNKCINYGNNWELKQINYQHDENFNLCNNSHENSIVSTLNTGNKCSRDLCCENITCANKFFTTEDCGDSAIIPSSTCPQGTEGAGCKSHCCGGDISGNIRKMFNAIKHFRNNLPDPGTFYGSTNKDISKISLIEIVYFIYYNILDLSTTQHGIEGLTNETVSYTGFHGLRTFLEERANGAIDTTDQKIIFDDISTSHISLNAEISDGINVVQFLQKFGVNPDAGYNGPAADVMEYSLLYGGKKDLVGLGTEYKNFLTTRVGAELDMTNPLSYTHDKLVSDIIRSIILMTIPSGNNRDGVQSPIQLFKLGEHVGWDHPSTQISLSEFQMYL